VLPGESELARLRARLTAATPVPLADTPALRTALDALLAAERRVGELAARRVVVGLLGGTGVGKSALLNALAGAEISTSGERRPTTDRIVCHRHTSDPLPAWLEAGDLASTTSAHGAHALQGVVILDLPDVDGWKTEHRERAWRVIPRLDLLIVVSSVEKYGDRVLYDELRALPQAARNRIFVLNKRDLLAPDALALVTADFAQKLERHAGAVAARVIAVSALEAAGPGTRGPRAGAGELRAGAGELRAGAADLRAEAGGLAPLRALLEGLGADAERRAVLEANATRALADAAGALDAALPRDPISRALAALDATLEPPSGLGPRERERLTLDLEAEIGPWISAGARRASWFPIGFLDFWARRARRRVGASVPEDPATRGGALAAEHVDAMLRRPLAVARRRAEEALRTSGGALAPELPELPAWTEASAHDPGLAFPAVAAWLAELPGASRRLAWKLRQHLLPGLALAAFALWLALEVRSAPAGIGALEALLAALGRAAGGLTLSGVGWALALAVAWYAGAWSYFVYRLARGVRDEAERGAEAYRTDFAAQWDTLWRKPLRAEGERLAALVSELERARHVLGGGAG